MPTFFLLLFFLHIFIYLWGLNPLYDTMFFPRDFYGNSRKVDFPFHRNILKNVRFFEEVLYLNRRYIFYFLPSYHWGVKNNHIVIKSQFFTPYERTAPRNVKLYFHKRRQKQFSRQNYNPPFLIQFLGLFSLCVPKLRE